MNLLENLNWGLGVDLKIFDLCGNSVYSNKSQHGRFEDFVHSVEKKFLICGRNQSFFNDVRLKKNSEALLQERSTKNSFLCEFKSLVDCQYYFFYFKNYSGILENFSDIESKYKELEDFIERASFGLIYTDCRNNIIGFNSIVQKDFGQNICNKLIQELIPSLENPYTITEIVPGKKMLIYASDFNKSVKIYLLLPYHDALFQMNNVSALSLSRIPSVLIDVDGRIEQFNEAFSELICVEKDSNFYDFILPAMQSEIRSRYKRVLENNNPVLPYEMKFKDGEITTTTYTSRIKDNNLFLLQFIDISERKQLEQQFIQSQKMQAVGQLAGGVAHDFNNLLTAILGFCDLLLQRHLPSDPSYTDLIQIKQNANRASNLVKQLLAFSRKQNLKPKVINPTDVLSELSALLRRLLGPGINLEMIHGRDLKPVKVDISQFEQVIINLVVNARDAMNNEGHLIIRTENLFLEHDQNIGHDKMPKGQYVVLTVEDTGCGISCEHVEHIFEPFFSTKEIGSGLGLSTVYGIIKQTGGFISVKSGKNGTKFIIYLPRYEGNLPITTQTNEGDRIIDLTGKERILFVEDEDAVRIFGTRALREKGYEVTEACDGEVAFSLIKKGEYFDLIITDVVMPKMDGPSLCREVQKISPETKILLISGYSEDILKYDHENIFFLPKPFNIKELASKVKEMLNSNKDLRSEAI